MLSKIIFNSPWYYVLLSILLSSAVCALLYYRNQANSETKRSNILVLFALRFVSLTMILFLLLNLFFRNVSNETEEPLVILAIDNSSSVAANADSTFIKGEFLKKLADLNKDLGKKYQVKTLYFGADVRQLNAADFGDKETDMENLLRQVENNYSNQNIGALVIASDGIYNKGANPVYSAEQFGFPVYAIAVGDTSEKKDLLIGRLQHNEVVYSGNDFPVEVNVVAKKFKGSNVRVTLQQEGSTANNKSIAVNSDNFVGTVVFTLSAQSPGLQRYRVTIDPESTESNKQNNTQSFVVEVINNRQKILLYSRAPHPDLAALKDAIAASPNYELELLLQNENPPGVKGYNLVIVQGFSSANLSILNECKTAQIPFLLISPLVYENLPGLRIFNNINRYNDAEPYVQNNFGLFTLSEPFRKFCNQLPAVRAPFGRYELSNGSHVLIGQRLGNTETENPLLYFTESGGVKAAVFIGDGLWQWRMKDYAQHKDHKLFGELISKTVQYLSVQADKSYFRISAPRIIDENSEMEIGAEVYNKSYESITEPEVLLELTNKEGKKFNYTFSKLNKSYKLSLGLLPAGDYKFKASTKFDNEIFVKQGQFAVREVVAEKQSLTANHQLLFQLAAKTGGKVYFPNQTAQLTEDLLKSEQIKPVTYTQTSTSRLIELKWLFWILLFIMATEWFFRKRFLNI